MAGKRDDKAPRIAEARRSGDGDPELHATADAAAAPAPDVEEIGRLMAGFVGELKKLDEALQLLAAYLTRLRAKSVPSGRILH